MKEMFGKRFYDSIDEIVNSKHTALLIVDMQNDFCKAGGHAARHVGTEKVIEEKKHVIVRLESFLAKCRKRGIPVVHIVNSYHPDGLTDSPAWLYLWSKTPFRKLKDVPYSVEGTWGAQIVDELKPLPNEPVVRKYRSSAFHATNLDLLLKNNGIESVLVTGTSARRCVESTAIAACFHDYYTVMVSDCIAPRDDTLKTIDYYDVVTSDEVLKAWDALGKTA